jgi:diguanylate cyclase (GGDEF)-like protein/PAS domain S-box-containing protein
MTDQYTNNDQSDTVDYGDSFYQQSLNALPVCAYICDFNGLITYFNQAAVSLWGRTPKLNDPEDKYCGSFKLYTPDGIRIEGEDSYMARALKENKSFEREKIVLEKPDGNKIIALVHINPIHDQEGNIIGAVNIMLDITERERAEEILLTIVEGTASVTGLEFFRAMVHTAATALKVNFALLTERISLIDTKVRSLAFWGNDQFGEMIEYDTLNTPCEKVISEGNTSYIPEKLQELFPQDPDLISMGVSSYLGVPIINDSGIVIGHLAVLHNSPIENVPYIKSILYLFAQRAAAEMARNRAEETLSYHASHDNLTGLINRHEFERRVERLLETVSYNDSEHALCYLDLDQFKIVNDTCGHIAGDEMLRQLSNILRDVVRHRDTLARLGGDEFAILVEHCSIDDAHRVVKSIQEAIQDFQFIWEGHSFKVGVSMGLVAINNTDLNLTELLKAADTACYIAKENGRNRIHIYQIDDTEIIQRQGEMQWVERLHEAIEKDLLTLYVQEIISLAKNKDKHYEILVRLNDKKGNIILPGTFLPAAERFNLITKIDRWVIKKAFSVLLENPDFTENLNFISINLSGQSITEEEFHAFIIKEMLDSLIPPEKICFEITETAAILNLNIASQFISKMKLLGCRFALDDFGSGLSSFAYLKNLPVNFLKIDGMFVKDISDDPIDHAMVKSINEIGHVMNMQTIAEFVENDEIKGMLKEIGVDYAQGYGIGKPKLFEDLINQTPSKITDIKDAKK